MNITNMKPNRIALFLAKILGKPEGENIKPSNATEYYLNEIAESGGGGGVFVVRETDYVLNKTFSEIVKAATNQVVVCINDDPESIECNYLVNIQKQRQPLLLTFATQRPGRFEFIDYTATGPDDYPEQQ